MIALVYAGSQDQYRHFIRENLLHQNQYTYIPQEQLFMVVQGYPHGTPVIMYGTYRERYDLEEALAVFKAREFEVIEWDEITGENERRREYEKKHKIVYGDIAPRTVKYALKKMIEEGTRPHIFEKFYLNQPLQEGS